MKRNWKFAVTILCFVGILKGFRPSAKGLWDYAVYCRGFTNEQMVHEVIPVVTPALLLSLSTLLFVTDALSYKPIIVLGACFSVATWTMTIWSFDSLLKAKIREWLDAVSIVATELAYFTYTYACVDKADYKRVTSYTHSAVHLGQFLSGLSSQLLLSFGGLGLEELNYLSLGGAVTTLLASFFLPRIFPKVNNQNQRDLQPEDGEQEGQEPPKSLRYTAAKENSFKTPSIFCKLKDAKSNLVYAYGNQFVLKWSTWYALAYGLFIQVELYNAEALWIELRDSSEIAHAQKPYNGAVHASAAIISFTFGLLIAMLKFSWVTWGNLIFGVGSLVQAGALYELGQTDNLYVAYGCLIIYRTIFQVLTIISKSLVAEHIKENSEAFIFGINAFGACIVQGLLIYIFVGKSGLALPVQSQSFVYAIYSAAIGLFLLIRAIIGKRSGNDERQFII